MGLGNSFLRYEGYGKTKHEAVLALGNMLRYHHGNVTVHRDLQNHYYAFDGRKHTISFTQMNGRVRAFISD